jgi:hypothetical protein
MGVSSLKNYKRLSSQYGGDPSLPARVLTLENNEYKVAYFASVNAASGTITIPTGATILLDQLPNGDDAYVSTILNSQPTGEFPQTAASAVVTVSSFNTSGVYTLSGTPSAFPVAIIYLLKISAANYSNLTLANILEKTDYNLFLNSLQVGTATPTSTYLLGNIVISKHSIVLLLDQLDIYLVKITILLVYLIVSELLLLETIPEVLLHKLIV